MQWGFTSFRTFWESLKQHLPDLLPSLCRVKRRAGCGARRLSSKGCGRETDSAPLLQGLLPGCSGRGFHHPAQSTQNLSWKNLPLLVKANFWQAQSSDWEPGCYACHGKKAGKENKEGLGTGSDFIRCLPLGWGASLQGLVGFLSKYARLVVISGRGGRGKRFKASSEGGDRIFLPAHFCVLSWCVGGQS